VQLRVAGDSVILVLWVCGVTVGVLSGPICTITVHVSRPFTQFARNQNKISYTSRHQMACFKVTTESYNVATRTAEPRRVKVAQNSQRSKASNAVLMIWSCAEGGGLNSFHGLEACISYCSNNKYRMNEESDILPTICLVENLE
jgi:hypothetical protein